MHQIGACEELVGRYYADKRLAGDAHKLGQAGTRGYVYCIEMLFFNEFVDGDRTAYDDVGYDFDTEAFEVFDFGSDNFLLRQAEFGYAVDEHAAGVLQGFEDGDLVPHLGEVASAGEARGAAADDGHFLL